MAEGIETSRPSSMVGGQSFLVRGALAVIVSVLGNVILLTAVLGSGIVSPMMHLEYPRVIVFTAVGSLLGVIAFAVLRTRVHNPARTFRRVAFGALLLSLVPDVGLIVSDPAVTVAGGLVLMAMHVVAAAVTVEALVGIR